jgi:hypothetical protein
MAYTEWGRVDAWQRAYIPSQAPGAASPPFSPSERHPSNTRFVRVLCTVSATDQSLRFVPVLQPCRCSIRHRGSRSFLELIFPPPLRPSRPPGRAPAFIAFLCRETLGPSCSPCLRPDKYISASLARPSRLSFPPNTENRRFAPFPDPPQDVAGHPSPPFHRDSNHSLGTARAAVAHHARLLVVVRLGR